MALFLGVRYSEGLGVAVGHSKDLPAYLLVSRSHLKTQVQTIRTIGYADQHATGVAPLRRTQQGGSVPLRGREPDVVLVGPVELESGLPLYEILDHGPELYSNVGAVGANQVHGPSVLAVDLLRQLHDLRVSQ